MVTTSPDVSLQDIGWIAGGIVALVLFMLYKDQAWAFLRGRFLPRQSVKRYVGSDRVMSRAVDPRTTAELVRPMPVKPDTYQANQSAPAPQSGAPAIVASHNMSDRELTLMLAAQMRDGKPRWSANEIVKIVGGTRQDVLDTIAIVRPREKPVDPSPPPKPEPPVSPIAGRAYDPKLFHSDNPELRYEEPTV
jgi:hypothetical protein